MVWGLIDRLIAFFGLRSARANAEKYERGETGAAEMEKQSRSFEKILWINSGLDVLYVLFGGWMASRRKTDLQRRGTGWGIVLQGAFLLVWDVALALLLRSKKNAG